MHKSKMGNGKVIITNRKARHDYHIIDSYEAGIVLKGTEVKSLRLGRGNLKDSYAKIENGEIFLYNFHISPYEFGNIYNHEPLRIRKLLLHKNEIKRLFTKTAERGLTLIPLRVYFKKGKVKVELALAKGKLLYDKREDLKKRDAELEVKKALRRKRKS